MIGWCSARFFSPLALGLVALVALVVISSAGAQGSGVDPTLVAHWRFDEGSGTLAADSAGANDGALQFGAAWGGPSVDGSSGYVRLDGSNDTVPVGNMDISGDQLTIACWFRADDFGVLDARLISKASGVQGAQHLWMLSTIRVPYAGGPHFLRFRLRTNGTTTTLAEPNGVLTPGVWVHTAAVYDGAQMRLYKDGVLIGSVAKTGTVAVDPAVGVAIGNQPAGAGPRPFDGCIDDMRIYERALTLAEIQSLAGVSLPPVAVGDSYTVQEDWGLMVPAVSGVLANDSHPDQQPIIAQLVQGAVNGVVTLSADGSFEYVPDLNFHGSDAFQYRASDGTLTSPPVTVQLTVQPAPDAPVASTESFVTDEDTPLIVAAPGVLANDSDVDGDALTAVLEFNVTNGTLTLAADGSFVYIPQPDFFGADSFTYHATDGVLDSNSVQVDIEVVSVVDAPQALADTYATDEDEPLDVTLATAGVLANDQDPEGLTLVAALVDDAQHGALTLNGDGTFTYTPDPDFFGSDGFTYQASNGFAASAIVAVTFDVTAASDAPAAIGESYGMDEDTTLAVVAPGVLANDLDVDGDALQAVLDAAGVSSGTLALNSDGSFSYTPVLNFTGIATFQYRATDGVLFSDVVTVTIDVAEVADPAQTTADVYTVNEDETLSVIDPVQGVLGNDVDPGGLTLTAVLVDDVASGTLLLNGDGTFSYTPVANYHGADGFTYRAVSSGAQSIVTSVAIAVDPVADAPTGLPDAYSLDEDTVLNEVAPGVLGNDSDNDGEPLQAVLVAGPTGGTLTLNADGSFIYTPDAEAFGSDQFTYEASDGTLSSAPVVVTLTIAPVTDPPLAFGESYNTDEDQPLSVAAPGVLGNDQNLEAQPLTAQLVGGVSDGVLNLSADGGFTYTPAPDFSGLDSFTYQASNGALSGIVTVTISVASLPDTPVALADSYTVTMGETLAVTDVASGVLGNDTDGDGDSLAATVVTPPLHGNLLLNADGTFTYAHLGGAEIADSFVYQASDGGLASNATVTLVIEALDLDLVSHWVFDAGTGTSAVDVVSGNTGTLQAGAAWGNTTADRSPFHLELDGVNDIVRVSPFDVPGTELTIACWFKADDFDQIDGRLISKATGPQTADHYWMLSTMFHPFNSPTGQEHLRFRLRTGGTTTTLIGTGRVIQAGVWIHATAVYDGQSMRLYQDGVLVGSVNKSGNIATNPSVPVAIGNQPAGAARPFDGAIDDVRIYDRALTLTEIQSLAQAEVPPVALPDSYTVAEDVVLVVGAASGLLANDTDPNFDPITAVLVTNANNGSAVVAADGSFSYTPDADYAGTDTFSYRANDGTASSALTSVTIVVTPVNDAPFAVADTYTTDEGLQLFVANPGVLGNDGDLDGDSLTATLEPASGPSDGALVLSADGSFTYTPDADFFGTDSFQYRAADAALSSAPVLVTITVNEVVDPPMTAADSYTVAEDGALVVSLPAAGVLGNDVDPGGLGMTAQLVDDATQGVLVLAADGTFTYTPDPNFSGIDGFTYEATNGLSTSTATAVTLTVTAAADAPVATSEIYSVLQDTLLTVAAPGVLGNDSDADGDGLVSVLDVSTTHGVLTLAADGSFTYQPGVAFVGVDTFQYHATDGVLTSATTTVTITVTEVILPPVTAADSYSTLEDTTLTVTDPTLGVLGNDVDFAALPFTATLDTGPTNGTLNLNIDGTFTYTPAANFNGVDSFTYVADNGTAAATPTTATINVVSVPDAPVALTESYTLNEDTPFSVAAPGVLANDTDIDGDPLSAILVTAPTKGQFTLNGDGSFSYVPSPNDTEHHSFEYVAFDGGLNSAPVIVELSVTPVFDAPTAVDDNYFVTQDEVLTADVSLSAPPGFVIEDVLSGLKEPSFLKFSPDGRLFISERIDGTLRVATLSATSGDWGVLPAPFATFDIPKDGEGNPERHRSSGLRGFTFDPDFGTNGYIYAFYMKDAPRHNRLVRIQADPANPDVMLPGSELLLLEMPFNSTESGGSHNGAGMVFGADGMLYFGTGDGWIGGDPIQSLSTHTGKIYRIQKDGVIPTDNPFYTVTTGDFRAIYALGVRNPFTLSRHPVTDQLYIQDVTEVNKADVFELLPGANYGGQGYTGIGTLTAPWAEAGTSSARVITGGEWIPAAAGWPAQYTGSLIVSMWVGAELRIVTSDSDPSVGTFASGVTPLGGHGPAALCLGPDNSLYYLLTTYETEEGSVYRVRQGSGGGAMLSNAVGVLANDLNIEPAPMTATLVAGPQSGTLVLSSDGTFVYTPNTGFSGFDSFTYVAENGLTSNTATVQIEVGEIAGAPDAVADSYNAVEDTPLTISAPGVLTNDVDPGGGTLSAALIANAGDGNVVLSSDGGFTYTPDLNFYGTDSFTYRANNGILSPVATVTITVAPLPDAPLASDDSYVAIPGEVLIVAAQNEGVLANDLDPDGDLIIATLLTSPQYGTLVLNADGTFTYTHLGGAQPSDSFTYQASDGSPSNVATVTISLDSGIAGLIHHWEFDAGVGNTAVDSVGSRDGTLSSGATWGGTSVDGSPSRLVLDGVNDVVSLGAFDLQGSALTIACWFRADDFDQIDGRLISKATGPQTAEHYWMLSTMFHPYNSPTGNEHLRFRLRTGGTTTTLIGTGSVISAGQWIHAAAVYDGATMRLYQDGDLVGSVAKSGTISTNPGVPVAIGNQPAGAGRPFDGNIDDMRIYDRALTAAEIQALAQP